jgi:hypothetical protein
MRRVLAALLLTALTSTTPAAQFRVASSSPADGAVAVPLSDTLRLTFTQPLAPAASPSIATFPEALITFGEPSLSVDGLTLSYPVTHAPDTRYVHLVLEAEAADGSLLERPFSVSYTTGGSAGSFTVTGTVSATAGSVDATVVALLGFDGADVTVVDATVLNGAGGAYALGPVPFGVYTVGAVRLPQPDANRTFAYGFYDPDGDGSPNPVIIPTGVNLTIAEPEPVLARSRLDAATTEAQSRAADAVLYELAEIPVDTTGRSPFWRYVFYSPAQDSTIEVVETGLIPLSFARAGRPVALAPIFGTWVDSDLALAAAEGAGGAIFRAGHAGQPQTLTLRAGLQPDVPTDATPCYRVAYRALDSGGTPVDSFIVYVTMGSGQVIFPTAIEDGAPQPDVTLETPTPNPGAGPFTLAFELRRTANVRLEIIDATGRSVHVLVEGAIAAGRHVFTWTPDRAMPAGVYLARLSMDGAVVTRRMVRRR